jgi:hypothetical protein
MEKKVQVPVTDKGEKVYDEKDKDPERKKKNNNNSRVKKDCGDVPTTFTAVLPPADGEGVYIHIYINTSIYIYIDIFTYKNI